MKQVADDRSRSAAPSATRPNTRSTCGSHVDRSPIARVERGIAGLWLFTVLMLVGQPASSEVVPLFQSPHFSLTLNQGDIANSPEFGDIDGDGDFDAFVGGANGSIYYFENVGTADSPAFADPVEDPFSLVDLGPGASVHPAFADIDDDGDLDLFIGLHSGSIAYFENIGSGSNPTFAAPGTNPFSLTDVGEHAAPTFVDIDDDDDLDALVGESSGSTHYFENIGTPASPAFAPVTIDPFGIVNINFLNPWVRSSPAFTDLDEDGDLDLYNCQAFGICVFQRNLGSAAAPAFGSPSNVPFSGVHNDAAPTFVDIDADGDLDAFIGEQSRTVVFFENTDSGFTRPNNPFGLAKVNTFASPAFADIEGDGDLDGFVGQQNGNIAFFENTGSPVAPSFASPATNPFGLTDLGSWASPTLADVDGDGDFDALIGVNSGLFYFENVGTPTAPSFAAAVESPFGISEFAGETRPSFADIDDDGDLDLFIGHGAGNFYFFLNTGSATAPAFPAFVINPFNLADVGTDSAPALADIDGDGDLDFFSGEGLGALVSFENVGSAAVPSFAPKTTNPFGLDDVGSESTPTFADIDGDGDLDLLVGGREGITWFFENVSAFGCPPGADTCSVGSTKALLSIKEKVPGKEKLIAKLNLAGPGISQSDFGNPLISEGTTYALCIYGDDDVLAGQLLVTPGGQCGATPCWKAIGGAPPDGKGMAYKDSAAASDGVSIIKAKASADGSGRLLVKATNKTGSQPLGIAAALAGDASALVQIRTSDDACFAATISDIRKNDATAFTGR